MSVKYRIRKRPPWKRSRAPARHFEHDLKDFRFAAGGQRLLRDWCITLGGTPKDFITRERPLIHRVESL
jgi:hypothetical protein